MNSMTIRLPRREKGTDCRVELYRWTNGVIDSRPAATSSIPAADLDPEGDLDPGRVQDFFLAERGDSDQFEKIGTKLFAAVFKDDVAVVWRAEPKEGLRIYLAIEDEELSRLPWELMTDDRLLPVFLEKTPLFLRWQRYQFEADGRAEKWPVRVLVVVGCRKEQAEELGVDKELWAIRNCLRDVSHSFDLEVLDARRERCNPVEIISRMECFEPHILHFIGHATADGGGALQLWDRGDDKRAGSWVPWPAKQITLNLRNIEHDLRLVYLNACRTYVQSEKSRPWPVASLAGAFFGANIPAVIAMQADIHGEAANVCATEFYRHLAEGDALDAALEVGRARIMEWQDFFHTRNPFVPVLTVQVEPEQILRFVPQVTDQARRDSIESCRILKPVRRLFVDQAERRRDLLSTFFAAPAGKERSAAVFRGSQDAGKSWLAKWLLAACAFQNFPVRYIEARHHADWLEMMRAVVKGGQEGECVAQPLPPKARDYFYWNLNHIALAKPVPLSKPPDGVTDENYQLTDAISRDNEAVSKIMHAFLEALRIAAGDGHFLLVADHWHASGDHSTAKVTLDDLKKNLWDRIAQNHQSRVKLLLILPPVALPVPQDVSDEYPEVHWKPLDFGEISGHDMPDLLLELYRLTYHDEPSEDELQVMNRTKTPALPKRLTERCAFIRRDVGGKA